MAQKNKNLKSNSQDLRKNATKEEKRLWYDYLKSYPLQFKRQKVIGNYIVDFYCGKVKLVIELDGSQHFEDDAIEYDKERTEYLKSLGISVLRFTNSDIHKNFEGVCKLVPIKIGELNKI